MDTTIGLKGGIKLAELDTTRIPVSDLQADDVDVLKSYNEDMASGNFSSAVEKLNNANIDRGGRASIFNSLKKKTQELAVWVLNLTADQDTFYSLEKPTDEQMVGKVFWVQPFSK